MAIHELPQLNQVRIRIITEIEPDWSVLHLPMLIHVLNACRLLDHGHKYHDKKK
jgi:hypothetical protein